MQSRWIVIGALLQSASLCCDGMSPLWAVASCEIEKCRTGLREREGEGGKEGFVGK